MKNCIKCGAEMQDDVQFCPACGAPQQAQEAPQQPYYAQPQQPYYAPQQPAQVKPFPVFGLIGMIAGIVAVITTWFLFYLGIAFSIVGIIFSAIGMAKRNENRMPGMAIAGLVCSIVAIVLTIVSIILAFAVVGAMVGA